MRDAEDAGAVGEQRAEQRVDFGLLRGVEVSAVVAMIVTCVTMSVGILIGLLAGFYGGKIDAVLMQVEGIHTGIFKFPERVVGRVK